MSHIQSLEDDKSIFLFVLNPPITQKIAFNTFYFCGYEGVRFYGNDFTFFPYIQITGLNYSSTGVAAEPQITIGDNGTLSLWVRQFFNLQGFELSVKKIKKSQLTLNNPLYQTPPDVFVISSRTADVPGKFITFKLKQRASFQNQIPARLITNTCSWKRYRGEGCNYVGSAKFDVNNQPTNDPGKDVCALTLKACGIRNNTSNFSGVPTINDF